MRPSTPYQRDLETRPRGEVRLTMTEIIAELRKDLAAEKAAADEMRRYLRSIGINPDRFSADDASRESVEKGGA